MRDQLLDIDIKCTICGYVTTLQKKEHVCDEMSCSKVCDTLQFSLNDSDRTIEEVVNDPTDVPWESTLNSSSKHFICRSRAKIEVQTSPVLPQTPNPSLQQSVTLEQSLHRSLCSPLSKEEERLHTKLTKHKLHFSKDKQTLLCKTGGQPLMLVKLKQARKPSSQAKSLLKWKHGRKIDHCRKLVPG